MIKKDYLKYLGGIALSLVVIYVLFQLFNLVKEDGNNYDERYKAYNKERNEFLTNRKLSKENIEIRKIINLVENYHHSDKNGLPLFYTYFQTNKYLDINEIDNELYQLKNKINIDSLDVNSLYIKAFFFTTNKETPYRTVLVKYDNLHLKPTYKQVTKPRSTKAFTILTDHKEPFRLNIQLTKSYKSGVIDILVYELKIDPLDSIIEIYSINPMPELLGTSTIEKFYNGSDSENKDYLPVQTGLNIFNKLNEVKMNYRSPIKRAQEEYKNGYSASEVMYNWELTFDDDTAFIRIRSDDVKGYYLVNKQNGHLFQVKTSFGFEAEVQSDYLIQYLSSDG